jgi:hypothetical protein
LDHDPEEQINLAKEHPEIVAKMNKEIDQWWQPVN